MRWGGAMHNDCTYGTTEPGPRDRYRNELPSVSEPIILAVRQVNGKYVGFGIAQDPYNTSPTAVNFVLMP